MPSAKNRKVNSTTGRIDVLAYRCAERLCTQTPLGQALWGMGLGQLVEACLADALPSKSVLPKPVRRLSAMPPKDAA